MRWIGLIAGVEERELVDIIWRLVVAGWDFAAALVEILLRVGGVFTEDKLPPGERL